MPSPTRTITPQESPMQQPKRKLESTVSTENATGGAKKKEKPIDIIKGDPSKHSIAEVMEIEQELPPTPIESPPSPPADAVNKVNEKETVEPPVPDVQESLKKIEELCDELMEKTDKKKVDEEVKKPATKEEVKTALATKTSPPVEQQPAPVKKEAVKKISSPVKRDMVKHKTSDLSGALTSVAKEKEQVAIPPATSKSQTISSSTERKESLVEEPTAEKPKTTEKRRSRILETAEKFQNMNNQNNEKYKKFSIPGVSVGNFKKEFERKASLTDASKKNVLDKQRSSDSAENDNDVPKNQQQPVATETQPQKTQPPTTSTAVSTAAKSNVNTAIVNNNSEQSISTASSASKIGDELNANSSKSSVISITMEDARRSMENSIALLQKAKSEASRSKEVENLCMRTESVTLDNKEREKKLQAAREIIGNAIPPSRLIGIRKPPVYGLHGRSISGGVISPQPTPRPYVGRQLSSTMESQAVLDKGTLWVLPSCAIAVRRSYLCQVVIIALLTT